MKIYPSLISADLLDLAHIIKTLDSYCDGYHIDVMDNHFVPNLTWGYAFIDAIKKVTTNPLDIHLMIDNPNTFIKNITVRPKDTLTFHIESTSNPQHTIDLIKEKNCKTGIAIKPKTPLELIFDSLGNINQVTIMSVEPGFSGQQFLPESIARLKILNAYRIEHNLSFAIAMDGGINTKNIATLSQNGLDICAAASAIFHNNDYIAAINALKKSAAQ
jgi:ribulose-phosphate 3-epimerase